MRFRSITQSLFLIVIAGVLAPASVWSSDSRPERIDQLEYFPCMDCHEEIVPILTRRELEEDHDDIEFDHGLDEMWCLTCHSAEHRDSLVAYGTQLIDFNQSQNLCGSCHGPEFRDWKLRLHGKAIGSWQDPGPMWLCVECHDPHSPAFKALEPKPAPQRPRGWRAPEHHVEDHPETTPTGAADHGK